MEAFAGEVLTACRTKYANACLVTARLSADLRAEPTYQILLNGAGDLSTFISLRADSMGIMLIIKSDVLRCISSKNEKQAMDMLQEWLAQVKLSCN